jgi:sphingolipid delta-4 desaturase
MEIRFETTTTSEPHARRRRALLARYPGIRALYGFDRRTAWVTAAVVVVQLGMMIAIAPARWWVTMMVAFAFGAPLTHWLSMAIHETSHGLAARTATGNRAVALLANVPMVLPAAMTFHRYHVDHHKNLDVVGKDTDLPLEIEIRLVGTSSWRKLAWLALHPLVYIARGVTFAKRPNRAEIVNIALMIGVDAAIVRFFGWGALGYLAAAFYFAHSLHPVAGHFIHEHYTFGAPGQETLSYYGPLNIVTFNVGYHNEHHDFMGIAGWRLPELRRLVPEYDELVSHRSWTGIMHRFVTDSSMSHASRIVRSSRHDAR